MAFDELYIHDHVELSLKQNALDYLIEALNYYEELGRDNVRASKFALTNGASFIELGLKYLCSLQPGESIYAGKETADGRRKTIDVTTCRDRCVELYGLDQDGAAVLKQVADDRNDVIHRQVDIRALDVRVMLANSVDVMLKMWGRASGESLKDVLESESRNKEILRIFDDLTYSLARKVTDGQKSARDEVERGEASTIEYMCFACSSLATRARRPSEIYCHVCGQTDPLNLCFHCEKEVGEHLTRYAGIKDGEHHRFCEECAMAITMGSVSHYETFMQLDIREEALDRQVQELHEDR